VSTWGAAFEDGWVQVFKVAPDERSGPRASSGSEDAGPEAHATDSRTPVKAESIWPARAFERSGCREIDGRCQLGNWVPWLWI